MKVFAVEQYELHKVTYYVRAESEAEAIHKLWNSGTDIADVAISDDGPELCEVDETRGMPTDENRELAEGLRKLGHKVGDDLIAGIRSIGEADPDEYDETMFDDNDNDGP